MSDIPYLSTSKKARRDLRPYRCVACDFSSDVEQTRPAVVVCCMCGFERYEK